MAQMTSLYYNYRVKRWYFALIFVLTLICELFAGRGALAGKHAFVLGGHESFHRDKKEYEQMLPYRGYQVATKFDAVKDQAQMEDLFQELLLFTDSLKEKDQLLLTLVCHGTKKKTAMQRREHVCCMNRDCSAYLSDTMVREIARSALARKASMAVIDSSCEGGSILERLKDLKEVCALSMTTPESPALAVRGGEGIPSIRKIFANKNVVRFSDFAEQATFDILRKRPDRGYQRGYMSACSERQFSLRDGLSKLTETLGDWSKRADLINALVMTDEVERNKELRAANETLSVMLDGKCVIQEENVAMVDVGLYRALRKYEDGQVRAAKQRAYSQTLLKYVSARIDLPVKNIDTLEKLENEIKARVKALGELRAKSDEALESLNAAVTEWLQEESSTRTDVSKKVEELRLRSLKLEKETALEFGKINPLLSVLEDLECSEVESSCKKLSL